MFDAQARQDDMPMFHRSEGGEVADQTGPENADDATTFERRRDIKAERPRFLCVGFAVIRI
jgi:hypothetical protein